MPNPFAPRVSRTPTVGGAPDHPPIGRLRRAGLAVDEIAEVRQRWAEMTDEERREALEALSHLTDAELAEGVEEARRDRAAEDAPPASEGGDVPDGTVDQVLGWVGDEPELAAAALAAEQAKPEPRVTLVRALEAIAGRG